MSATGRSSENVSGQSTRAAARTKQRSPPSPFYVPLNITLYIFLISNGIAAFNAPIQDCDEVFNFWEPTHYLDHGYGLQTWEYSPVYSIRSWLYISAHAAVGKIGSLFFSNKVLEFFAIRFFLAVICAACQTRLYSAVCRTLSPRIGLLFLMIAAFSPGMFHASASFLPASFTMYTSMLGLAAFLDWRGGQKIPQGIMWFGLGAIVGWPFAGALVIPLLLEELAIGFIAGSMRTVVSNILNGILRCLAIMWAEIAVDYVFLKKFTVVPWNIVAYNVFGGQGRGPEIFGTEPWAFYIRNLLLNFNIWFILAISAAPLLVLQALFRLHATSKQTLLRTVTDPKELMGRIPTKLKLVFVISTMLFAINSGMLRIVSMITAYNAPLKVFEPLWKPEVAHGGESVCFGKEWYRFPSSFFLPNGMRAKFIRSEFRGLLPGEFPDATSYKDLAAGTSQLPTGMNDRNMEDPGKYVDLSQCSFLVDSYFPGHAESELEPNYVLDESHWDEVSCKKFLDASQTNLLGRLIWIPDLPIIPAQYRRKWGEFCLLKRLDTREN
ncbi:Alpha-1,2-mannosyltransferase [Aspergillus sclerotialis]|uniref:Mannosyltransferase n=1 Tax=Aspergillus sclerotialis TaxID=2070753 RepID=A0A3A2ZJ90_9EURO|nr:Alpha-1,2-mannosyltransferase [Aspergillus sclerotialis]